MLGPLIPSILFASLAGTGIGFAAGLVPGLHMNNIAAALTWYAGGSLGIFAVLGTLCGGDEVGLIAACLISSALVGHQFSSAITSTYVGIPSEDIVSVLPAHRLAKAGLGRIAVAASADGSFFGVIIAALLLIPVCAAMGSPAGLYSVLKRVMVPFIILLSAVLLASEKGSIRSSSSRVERTLQILKASSVFLCSGVLGTVVLRTDFYACSVPDFPWLPGGYVTKSSLLLPMFAGLFGVSGLLLSLGSRYVLDAKSDVLVHHVPRPRDMTQSVFGGLIVGWMPGMTSGSAATLCSPRTNEADVNDVGGAVRFIWLYSSITASGAIFAVGALFTIERARSGSMDAAMSFLGNATLSRGIYSNISQIASIVLSMLVASIVSYSALRWLSPSLSRLRHTLCSRNLALTSLAFVCSLSLILTGTRGSLLLMTATTLGLIPPLIGVRRIQLMGCLLVPIVITYLVG